MNHYRTDIIPSIYLRVVATLLALATLSVASPAKKPEIAPSYAWTMLEPLCMPQPSTIDTLFLNYSSRTVPSLVSPAYATTGNFGAPGRNMIYFHQRPASDFFFRDAISHWIPTPGEHKFYNTRVPMTLLSYTTGGSRDNAQERLGMVFSGNVNKQLQIGANLDYPYSKGSYDNQAAKGFTWGLSGSYMSDRIDVQAFFDHYNHVNRENGGITDDKYITDPAELQGGSTSINPKSIPTRLKGATSRVTGTEFLVNARYKVGFWHTLPPRDSVPDDTVVRRVFVPVSSFIYTFDYLKGRHVFNDTEPAKPGDFWSANYLTAGPTHDMTRYHSVRNTLGISLLEGFNRYAKAGLAAFITHEFRSYTQAIDTIPTDPELRPSDLAPYPVGQAIAPKHSENLLWVGARLSKQRGTWIRYDATARLGLIGRVAGDIDVAGSGSLRIPLLRDTLAVTAYGAFANKAAPYLFENYVSNHFIWHNNFGKTRTLRLGGRLDFARTGTHLDIGVENIQNAIYFDELCLPAQHSGSVQVFSASLRQDLQAGILHWDNSITYQTTTDDRVIPMPKLSVYSNLYILFTVARVLHVQLGIDCDYYTKYYSPGYQPATMTFHTQREMKVGNYPFMNAYINMKLRKARFFVMMSHVNQGLTGSNYFAMPHYPLNPRRFQMGVSVDFAN